MKLLFEPPPVYFMHVPKTGGTALGKWLRTSYGRRDYIDLDVPSLASLSVSELRQFSCYHACHHGRSMLDLIGRSDLAVITMLRAPIERAVSGFYERQRAFAKHPENYDENYRAQFHPLIHLKLEEGIEHKFVVNLIQNVQTRSLGIRKDYFPFLRGRAYAQPDRPLLCPFPVPVLIDPNNGDLLFSNARAWLSEMAVVGLTERYAESILLISDFLGIPASTDLPRANVNPQRTSAVMRYRDQLSPAVVAQLEELNRYDLELYAYASELFEQQWARYQARPRRTYSIAPRLRRTLRPVKAIARRIIKG
jgi:hypothetical protein